MLSKKHYIEVARIIKEAYLPTIDRDNLVYEFIKFFKADNPRFDSGRFCEKIYD